jgi:hypothetical protein
LGSLENFEMDRRFVSSASLFGAAMAVICLLTYLAASGGDLGAMFRPDFALAMTPTGQTLFHISQVADVLSFYLPVLVIGIYLQAHLRERYGVIIDVAASFIVISTLLGIAGSAIQIATLPQLTAAYAGGDTAVRSASEIAWLTVVHAAQKGLWVMEGPTLGFWAMVTGAAMRRDGSRFGAPLVAIGVAYLAYAALVLCGFGDIAQLGQLVILPAQVVWMALFGLSLRQSTTH